MNESIPPSNLDEDYHEPGTVGELVAENVEGIAKLEAAAKSDRTMGERMAARVATFCGSIAFLWVNALWFGAWLVLNTAPGLPHFDPYPYTFLTLVVSLEAIFLSIFILISQNVDFKLSERRNHLDLQINLLAEQENTKMLRLLKRIADKVGVTVDDDPSLEVLEQSTRPEKLAEQIEKSENGQEK